ncbi:CRISPR-associated endonuclease Cas3'' [Streptacidiphilus sp. N8-3]|uniref:CRISPR-associated endonuclease Cas3 n=1 Tax=Streptacidiphilus cavernicola TaxID=3342716 RepID=A0ABV6W4E4_9ACTN
MTDSAAVAGLLWDRWLPAHVRRLVAEPLPAGESDGRTLAVWLAAVHDIGKATPAFACQVDALADQMRGAGLAMPYRQQMGPDRRLAPHGLAGQLLLQEWLEERHNWPVRATGQFAVVIGGHHGTPPDNLQVHTLDSHPELLRTPGPSETIWRQVQEELLNACAGADVSGAADRLADWQRVKLPQTVQVLLSALVIVADWIASNTDLFPYAAATAAADEDTRSGGAADARGPEARSAERVAAAWRGLGLPEPWSPEEPKSTATELFAARFDLPPGATPRPVQEAALRIAREMPEPGLLIVEAPMGEGKTEAALAVAEVFAARSGAGGVFLALPTMATGNAMFPRLLDWLDHLPSQEGRRLSVLLAHSKAALNQDFAELKTHSQQQIAAVDLDGPDGDDPFPAPGAATRAAPAELVAHQWLNGRKKGMLSSFVVGTIDQLLFAGLKSRHLALRHLALAGKVVVIDEAHAYDTYMNSYLDRVLSWLGAYRVPVVVLSATLPAARRRELAAAYAGVSPDAEAYAALALADGYPLLTAVAPGPGGHPPSQESPEASGRGSTIRVEALPDDLDILADRLQHELTDGGCVLIVRNTVNRVLETAQALRDHFGEGTPVTVAHARFIDLDRAANDAELLRRFGPPHESASADTSAKAPPPAAEASATEASAMETPATQTSVTQTSPTQASPQEDSAARRPPRHIVVASQVAEQSLDVDFDLLVTDLAPIDLLLQRMGRLHRHARDRRPERLGVPRCLVTGADWTVDPPAPVRGSEIVYGRHSLLRSLAVLLPHLGIHPSGTTAKPLRLPEDISPLVQQAYGSGDVGPSAWAGAMDEARDAQQRIRADKERRAATFRIGEVAVAGRSLVGWLAGGTGDADDTRAGRAQVRDSQESLEVIVVQRQADGTLTTVDWIGQGRAGLPLPEDAVPTSAAAKAAAACGLRLPLQLSHPGVIDQVIAELEQFCVPAWQSKESHWLAGELILPVQPDCQTHLAGFVLSYHHTQGLEVRRDD